MDEKGFTIFLKQSKRVRPNAKSQIGHVRLLEDFLQKEKGKKPLKDVTVKDLKEFAVWKESSRPTTANALVHGIRNYYRYLSKERMVKTAGELYSEYCELQRQTSKRTWTDRWILGLLKGLNELVSEEKRTEIMYKCGQACFNTHWHQSEYEKWKKLYRQSENLEEFLTKLEEANPGWFKHEGKVVYATFDFLDGCVCPIVKKIPHDVLPGTWCLCSAGLHRALFEETLKRPVKVILEESRRTGAKHCKFRIIL